MVVGRRGFLKRIGVALAASVLTKLLPLPKVEVTEVEDTIEYIYGGDNLYYSDDSDWHTGPEQEKWLHELAMKYNVYMPERPVQDHKMVIVKGVVQL